MIGYVASNVQYLNVQSRYANMTGNMTMASQEPVSQCATMPHLNTFRQDVLVQEQLEKRFKELAEAVKTGIGKQKSLRDG